MKINLRHKTIETFHFSAALNVIMMLLIFVMIVLAANFKYGVKVKITSSKVVNAKPMNTITIDGENVYLANDRIPFANLPVRLKQMKKSLKDSVEICPAWYAKLALVGNVIGIVKKAGIKNITLQTVPALF